MRTAGNAENVLRRHKYSLCLDSVIVSNIAIFNNALTVHNEFFCIAGLNKRKKPAEGQEGEVLEFHLRASLFDRLSPLSVVSM